MPTLADISKPSLAGFGKYVNSTGVQDWQSPEAQDFLKRIQAYDPNARWLDRSGGGDGGQSLGATLDFDITKMPKAQGSDPVQGNMPVLSSGAMEVSQPGFATQNILYPSLVHRNDPVYGDWTAGNNVPQKEEWQDKLGKYAFMTGGSLLAGMAGSQLLGLLAPQLAGTFGSGLGKFGFNEIMSGGRANPVSAALSMLGGAAGSIPGLESLGGAMQYLKPAITLAQLMRSHGGS